MAKTFDFQEYWDALDPFESVESVGMKENILRSADKDPNIDCMQFKQLVVRDCPDT